MNLLKSVYVSVFISAGLVGLIVSLVQVASQGLTSPWTGAALACAAPTLFFARAYLAPFARTPRHLHLMLATGALGTGISAIASGWVLTPALILAAGVGVVGVLLYDYWYSRFTPAQLVVLKTGLTLPDFPVQEADRTWRSSDLLGKPALWMFFRGNWCPLCMAQIREVAAQYQELARRGVEVFLVSPQPQAHTAALAAKLQVPMRFLTDAGNAAAQALGVMERNGLPAGMQALGYDSDVPRPTVFITAAGGRLLYCDLSENYRVRPEPAEFLAVLDAHAIG